ncbi:hypothetical protein IG631_14998 [Alternaria alternata]|nr:hypothetical protein IG631_14998 [Alternaria alternata]
MAVCQSVSLRDTRCKRAMLVSHVYLLSTVIWKVWGPGSMGLGSRWRKPCGGPPNDLCSRRFFPVETSSSISLPPTLGLPLSASAKLYRDVDDREELLCPKRCLVSLFDVVVLSNTRYLLLRFVAMSESLEYLTSDLLLDTSCPGSSDMRFYGLCGRGKTYSLFCTRTHSAFNRVVLPHVLDLHPGR